MLVLKEILIKLPYSFEMRLLFAGYVQLSLYRFFFFSLSLFFQHINKLEYKKRKETYKEVKYSLHPKDGGCSDKILEIFFTQFYLHIDRKIVSNAVTLINNLGWGNMFKAEIHGNLLQTLRLFKIHNGCNSKPTKRGLSYSPLIKMHGSPCSHI